MSNIIFDENKFTKEQSDKICKQYKNRVPIIIWEISDNILIKKRKFIVPVDITMGQFLYVLRKQIKNVNEYEGLFLFIYKSNVLPSMGDMISKIYAEHSDNGFLKLSLTKENTFG